MVHLSEAPEFKPHPNTSSSHGFKRELVLARCSSDVLWKAALQLKLDGGLLVSKTGEKVDRYHFFRVHIAGNAT